jgi:predicted PurR-regulated permease PerM
MTDFVIFADKISGTMESKEKINGRDNRSILAIAVDLTLKIGTLLLIIFFCFKILKPFISILLWALIIAIVLAPIYHKFLKWFGEKKRLAAITISIVGLAILLLPSFWLVESMVQGVMGLSQSIESGNVEIPPPPESVSEWPIAGEWLYENWLYIQQNLSESIRKYLPQFRSAGEWILQQLAGTGLGILYFALSIIIASVLLTYSKRVNVAIDRLFMKLAGQRGQEYADVAERTIKNVAIGVIGVAVIQTTLFGAGMVLGGVPLAGFWILITLILAIIQVPMFVVTIPLIIWSIAMKEPLPAVLWSVYFVVVGLVDNVLKPLIMGAGSSVPMLVIFLGALGGFISYGFLGLFFGAFIVSIGYELYQVWLETD